MSTALHSEKLSSAREKGKILSSVSPMEPVSVVLSLKINRFTTVLLSQREKFGAIITHAEEKLAGT